MRMTAYDMGVRPSSMESKRRHGRLAMALERVSVRDLADRIGCPYQAIINRRHRGTWIGDEMMDEIDRILEADK